jgi:hypothetical protein
VPVPCYLWFENKKVKKPIKTNIFIGNESLLALAAQILYRDISRSNSQMGG